MSFKSPSERAAIFFLESISQSYYTILEKDAKQMSFEKEEKDISKYVIPVDLDTEKWQEDVLHNLMNQSSCFQNMFAAYVIKCIAASNRGNTQYNLSRKFEPIRSKIARMKKRKEYIEKDLANGKSISSDDLKFLDEFSSRISELQQIVEKIKVFYPNAKTDDDVSYECFKYVSKTTKDVVINKAYTDKDPKKAVYALGASNQGLVGLAGQVLSSPDIWCAKNGKPFGWHGITVGIARGCAKSLWLAIQKKYMDWDSWKGGVYIKTDKMHDSIMFDQCIGASFNPKTCTIVLNLQSHGNGYHGDKNFQMVLKLRVGKRDAYRMNALNTCGEVNNISLIRVPHGTKWRFSARLNVNGIPPFKKIEHRQAVMGIDPAPDNITTYTEGEKIAEVCKYTGPKEKRRDAMLAIELQRKMDRSDRMNNPENYDELGRAKKGSRNKHSKNYLKLQTRLHALKRKFVETRKNNLGHTINSDILPKASIFKAEKCEIKDWQKRDEIGRGKNGKKKRYGKSIASFATAEVLKTIEMKAKRNGQEFFYVPAQFGATQYDPINKTFTQHDTSERWLSVGGEIVPRDPMSAFNIVHAKEIPVMEPILNKNGKPKMRKGEPVMRIAKTSENFDSTDIEEKFEKFVEAQKMLDKQ